MKPEHVETLAALLDGERVDPALLADALKDPDAPTLLADFAALRVLAQEDSERPGDDFYASMSSVLREHRMRRFWKSLVRPAIAASLLSLAGLGGYLVRPAIDSPPPAIAERAPARNGPSAVPVMTSPQPQAPPVATAAVRPRRLPEDGPPPPVLRLRFSQWVPAVATVQPH